jgi:hypothetical protein
VTPAATRNRVLCRWSRNSLSAMNFHIRLLQVM